MKVDNNEEENRRNLVLPHTLNWTIGEINGRLFIQIPNIPVLYCLITGAKSDRNGIGLAGVLRNVYLNGNGLPLGLIVRETNSNGIHEGEKGKSVFRIWKKRTK